jgi:hypothetical protein
MQVQATVVDPFHIGCIPAFICETQPSKVSCGHQVFDVILEHIDVYNLGARGWS